MCERERAYEGFKLIEQVLENLKKQKRFLKVADNKCKMYNINLFSFISLCFCFAQLRVLLCSQKLKVIFRFVIQQ
jgi:hypothetical protein